MDSHQWFGITKEALSLVEKELDPSYIDLMVLIYIDSKTKVFSTSNRQTDVNSASLIGHAWQLLADNLSNDLSLEGWNSVSIKGRNKCVTIYAF
ncbi:MAG: hypothetical protein ACXACR_07595 [Candidatus Hodarchaeales archaeon]|jgi:hypothetical protein